MTMPQRRLGLSVFLGAFVLVFFPSASGAAWQVGTARVEITPPLEVGILMSSGRQAWAPFQGVRAPLYARALVVESGATRVGLVSLDLLGLAGTAVGGIDAFRQRIADAARGTLPADKILFACSHTHSGPETLDLTDLDRTRPFQDWAAQLARRMGAALAEAAGALRPARLATGSTRVPGLAENRRLRTARGITSSRALKPGDVVYGPEGPTDDTVRVLAFLDPATDRPLALVVQATAHPVYEMCIRQVAPDYPGETCRLLEQGYPGARVLFLQGAAGNINPGRVSTGADDARAHGARLAHAVAQVMAQLRPAEGNQLALRWRVIGLPGRTVTGQMQPEPLAARVAALRLGDAAVVFLPGEAFVEIGLGIITESPFRLTVVAAYSNDYLGYLPTDRAFLNGGYEIGPGRWSRAALGSEGALRRNAVELLREIR
jgi:neutral ceramidase